MIVGNYDEKMMKVKLFSFNEKSILNNGIARNINGISLGVIGFLGIANEAEFEFKLRSIIFLILASSILSIYAANRMIKGIDFFEWDYTERKKKSRFVAKYLLICSIFSSLFMLSGYILYLFMFDDMPVVSKILGILPTIIFGFNILNIVSLFHPFFAQELTLGYKIQKKPENWQDNGREIKNEDEIEEIMHRDFGI